MAEGSSSPPHGPRSSLDEELSPIVSSSHSSALPPLPSPVLPPTSVRGARGQSSPLDEPLPPAAARSLSRNEEVPGRSSSRQQAVAPSSSATIQQISGGGHAQPAWMTNEMTSLSMLARSVSVPKAPTPRPPLPPSSVPAASGIASARNSESSSSDSDDALQQTGEEDSRMLRHLEQHHHLQEEMHAEEMANPHRSQQIQRENDRLLHIAMRRDRNAKNSEKSHARSRSPPASAAASKKKRNRDVDDPASFSPPSPLHMDAEHNGSGDDGDLRDSPFRARKMTDDNAHQVTSKRSSFFSRHSVDSNRPSPKNLHLSPGGAGGDESSFASISPQHAEQQVATTTVPSQSIPSPRSASAPSPVGPHPPASGEESPRPDNKPPSDGGNGSPSKSGALKRRHSVGIPAVMTFGFARRESSAGGNVNSSQRKGMSHGSSSATKTRAHPHNHLPPSFLGGRQRARLVDLVKRIDLEDATVMDAVLKRRPLHPQGKFRRRWDSLLALCVIYTLIVVPFEVAWAPDELAFRAIGITLDILFISDVFLAFRTSYREVNDEYVRDFDQIAKHYLRTWFFFDLIAAIPINILFTIISNYLAIQHQSYFSLLKLVKLFRIVRLRHLFHALAGLKVSAFIYLFLLVAGFVIAAHWFACIFWKIADLEQDAGAISWASEQTSIPDLFSRPIGEQYSTAIYWSMATISTLGYGDIRPRAYAEQIYASIVIIIGASLYAAVIGLVAYIMRSQFDTDIQRENHVESMRTFGRHYHLPSQLQSRIEKYYDFLWERKKRITSKSLVDDLPLELRADVADAVHKKFMETNPVLRVCTSFGFQKLFAARLSSSSTVRMPEDVLFFEGDVVTEVFFIKKGLVELVFGLDRGSESEFVLSRRSDGQHLGDMGLFIETGKNSGSSVVQAAGEDKDTDDGDDADEESEEETEFSPADHFILEGSESPRINKTSSPSQKKTKRTKQVTRKLHHTSALVIEFSEISSILATDFLQLLDLFPRERKLFKRVAEERFKRTQEMVSTRMALLNQAASSPGTQSVPNPDGEPSSSSVMGRALSTTKGFFVSSSNIAAASASQEDPDASAPSGLGMEETASPRFRTAMTTLGILPPSAHERASLWRKTWLRRISPEVDDELVSQTVESFIRKEKKPSNSSPHQFHRKQNGKRQIKASEYLMSPVSKPQRPPRKRDEDPVPKVSPSVLKSARERSRSENNTSLRAPPTAATTTTTFIPEDSPSPPAAAVANATPMLGRTPPLSSLRSISARQRRLSLAEVPSSEASPMRRQDSFAALLGQHPAPTMISNTLGPSPSIPTAYQIPSSNPGGSLEDRLRALLDKVQRLDAELDASAISWPLMSASGGDPNSSLRTASEKPKSPLEASVAAGFNPAAQDDLSSSAAAGPSSSSSSSFTAWKKKSGGISDVRGLM